MPDCSVAISDLQPWFGHMGRAECEALLLGCELDSGDEEDAGVIARIEWRDGATLRGFHLAGGRRVSYSVSCGMAVWWKPRKPRVRIGLAGGAAEGEWICGEAPGRCLFRSVWLGTCPLLVRFDRFAV